MQPRCVHAAFNTTTAPLARVTATEKLAAPDGLTCTTFVEPSATSLDFTTNVRADEELIVGELVAEFAFTATPLSQTKLLPFLIHVYFLLRKITVCPTWVGLVSGPVAAIAPCPNSERNDPETMVKNPRRFKFMGDTVTKISPDSYTLTAMAIHPQVQAYLDYISIHNPLPEKPTLQQSREDVYGYIPYAGPQSQEVDVEHAYFTSPTADLHAVIFKPKNVKPNAPALVYFHGGGWIFSFPLRYAASLSNICAESGFIVIAVNYQKTPEHPFPTPFDDCYAGLLWVAAHAARLGIDPKKIGVGGDSAGGNLAAAVALKAADTADVELAYQMLIYPCIDTDFETESYKAHATGFGLDRTGMIGAWDLYVPKVDRANKYAVPARATTFTNLAPAIIALAEHDVLRDDGANYAAALEKAGIDVTLKQFPGMIHGFLNHGLMVDGAYELRTWLSAQIVDAVTRGRRAGE